MYWNFPNEYHKIPQNKSDDIHQFVSYKLSRHCLGENKRFQWQTALLFLQAAAFSGTLAVLFKLLTDILVIQIDQENIFFFWQSWAAFKGITCFKLYPSTGALKFDTLCRTHNLPPNKKTTGLQGWLCIYIQPHTSAFTRVRPLAVNSWLLVNI